MTKKMTTPVEEAKTTQVETTARKIDVKNITLSGGADGVSKDSKSYSVMGYMVAYSVQSGLYLRKDIQRSFLRANLDKKLLPNEIRPIDAFRRATSQVQAESKERDGQIRKKLLVKEVYTSDVYIYREVVREIIDKSKDAQSAKYETQVAKFIFDKTENQIGKVVYNKNKAVTDEQKAEVASIELQVNKAIENFNIALSNYSDKQIRPLVVSLIERLNPIPMKVGNLYFIHADYGAELTKVEKFMEDMGLEFIKIDVIDTNKQIDLVRDRYIKFVEGLVEQSKGDMTPTDRTTLMKDLAKAQQDYHKFVDIVSIEQAKVDLHKVALEGAVKRLQDSMKRPKSE